MAGWFSILGGLREDGRVAGGAGFLSGGCHGASRGLIKLEMVFCFVFGHPKMKGDKIQELAPLRKANAAQTAEFRDRYELGLFS